MLIELKKNGQVASVRTRRIVNRGGGLYRLLEETADAIRVECAATRWNGWIDKKEVVIKKLGSETP